MATFKGEFQEVCHWNYSNCRQRYWIWPMLYDYKSEQHCSCPACTTMRERDVR